MFSMYGEDRVVLLVESVYSYGVQIKSYSLELVENVLYSMYKKESLPIRFAWLYKFRR